jgi:hypothetical protein
MRTWHAGSAAISLNRAMSARASVKNPVAMYATVRL